MDEIKAKLLRDEVGPEFATLLPQFVDGMVDRMIMSAYKYGPVTPDLPKRRDLLRDIELRIEKYRSTHNTEYLIDVANFCVMESLFPQFPDAYFKSTDSDASPGVTRPSGEVIHKESDDFLRIAQERRDRREFLRG